MTDMEDQMGNEKFSGGAKDDEEPPDDINAGLCGCVTGAQKNKNFSLKTLLHFFFL